MLRWAKKPSLRPGARGRKHWKSKAKTERLRRELWWAKDPFSCLIGRNRYACKRLDRALWDKHAAPLWELYEPAKLAVVFPSTAGTRTVPYSMYNIRIVHKEKGLLLDGTSLELYYMSASPEAVALEASAPVDASLGEHASIGMLEAVL